MKNRPDTRSPMLQAMLQDAVRHHQEGRLAEAEKLYNQILAREPQNPDALHLLGLIAHQTGNNRAAINLIEKAIASRKDAPLFHYHLGIACFVCGENDKAINAYKNTLALDPNNDQAHNNLGFVLFQQGRLNQAATHFEKALSLNPNYAEAHNNLGLILKERGELEEAKAHFERAVSLKPDHTHALNNLGVLFRLQGFPEKALTYYERAIALQPDYIDALNNLGNILRDLGKLGEAQKRFEHILALKPDYAEAHSNLGNIHKDRYEYDEALARYTRSLELKPDFAAGYYNMGIVYQETNRHREAMDYYNRALALQPDYADALWNQALILLLTGSFEEGWQRYERRWIKTGPHAYKQPLWDGSELQGKKILLHCEQGLGDSLQFIRYAPMVKQRGGRVIVACPPTLVRIFKSVEGIDKIVPQNQPAPHHDCQAPLLSLPLLFNTRIDNIPASVPYLTPPPEAVAFWADRLKSVSGMKVGLVWSGDPRQNNAECNAIDRRRSMRLELFTPLANIPNVTFISLQKGDPAEQAKNPPAGMKLLDFMNDAKDYADTAALIANLDLVIGVDTSVIHMAGALAKPVWVLSRFDGCWRWLLDRSDSPWYPTMRLFRQSAPNNWAPVVEEVRAALQKW